MYFPIALLLDPSFSFRAPIAVYIICTQSINIHYIYMHQKQIKRKVLRMTYLIVRRVFGVVVRFDRGGEDGGDW